MRFWGLVSGGDVTTCWVWTGAKTAGGYGTYRGRVAHKQAFEEMVGEVPAGLQLDHLCRNKACVNPYHLDPVTRAVNMERARYSGPCPKCGTERVRQANGGGRTAIRCTNCRRQAAARRRFAVEAA